MRTALAASVVLVLLSGCGLTGWYPRALYGYSNEEIGNALIEIDKQKESGQISPEEAEEQVRIWLDRLQPCSDCGPKTYLYPVNAYGRRIPGNGYVVETR